MLRPRSGVAGDVPSAFGRVTRSTAVPRPRPKAVPSVDATTEYALPSQDPTPASTPRPTLLSVDLEVLAHVDARRASTIPPPLPERAREYRQRATTPRRSHPEMADAVFSALRDLAFFETAVEAASFGVVTALRALPSLAAVALLRDEEHGGFVVVYARGPRSHAVVRSRHASFGEPWTALVAPITLEDRCIGVLELIDPLDGRTLGESSRHALTTITQHLAMFLRGREMIVRDAFAPEQVGLED